MCVCVTYSISLESLPSSSRYSVGHSSTAGYSSKSSHSSSSSSSACVLSCVSSVSVYMCLLDVVYPSLQLSFLISPHVPVSNLIIVGPTMPASVTPWEDVNSDSGMSVSVLLGESSRVLGFFAIFSQNAITSFR